MPRTALTSAALTFALTQPALAQLGPEQSVRVVLSHNDEDGILHLGESAIWSLSVEYAGFEDRQIVSSINASISANNPTLASSDSGFVYTIMANGGNNGGTTDNQGGIGFVHFINSLFLNQTVGDGLEWDNPQPVGRFETVALNPGQLTYDFSRGLATSAFITIDTSPFSTLNVSINDVTFDTQILTIVPAPASALLIAPAAMLAAGRRRR